MPMWRIFLLLLVFTINRAHGQGLGFYNNESDQDRRTSLDLSPQPFSFGHSFDVSFAFGFSPGHLNYFGYILRLVRNDTQNIDLLFDKVAYPVGHFRAVVGDRAPFASFTLDSGRLFNDWDTVTLRLDYATDRVTLLVDGRVMGSSAPGLRLAPSDSYRISFGACSVPKFQKNDVPPMKIRDVRIVSRDRLLYRWPLDEEKGSSATETERGAIASVFNPLWIKSTHYEWALRDSLVLDGPASCAFDAVHGHLFLVGRDSMLVYSVSGGSLLREGYTAPFVLLAGNQSVYDPFTRDLFNIYPDEQLAAAFDFPDRRWDRAYRPGDINYWQHNKFVSSFDTSIYVLDGYGHMTYKNTIFRYHIPTHTWSPVAASGDVLTPRYLAAAGTTPSGDTAYVLGGYGSSTGQQILNSRNLYDMMRFDVRTGKFHRLFELSPAAGEDFTFANSLVIDGSSFYGLIFNNQTFHSSLQLIKGSLDTPAYQAVGDRIPYPFHDIESFSDLYYNPSTRQFLAVVFFSDSTATRPSHTVAHIYTLDAPVAAAVGAPAPASPEGSSNWWYLLLPLGLVGSYLVARPRRRPGRAVVVPVAVSPAPVALSHAAAAVHLFGDLQVFDTEGGDLTKQFSPLLKQLFLLILLYSLKNDRGISSEKLDEILWFDKDEKSARNNRSVNIAKLKALLDKTGGFELSKKTGYWKFDIDASKVYVDYQEYLSLIHNPSLDKQGAKALAAITRRGSLLGNVEYPWLDPFKSDVSNHVIDTYLHFVKTGSHDPDFLIEIADDIFYFDSVNEEAMAIKCKALVQLGKHSLAKNAYTSFTREYKHIYGEDFKREFQTVLQG